VRHGRLVGWVKRSADPTPLWNSCCVGSSLTLDPTCAPTDAFASVGIPLLQVRVDVVDAGGWTVVPGSSQGAYNAVSELGGTLAALASGCIGGQEVASISITGTLGHDDDDRADRDDDDADSESDDDDDDDDDKGRRRR